MSVILAWLRISLRHHLLLLWSLPRSSPAAAFTNSISARQLPLSPLSLWVAPGFCGRWSDGWTELPLGWAAASGARDPRRGFLGGRTGLFGGYIGLGLSSEESKSVNHSSQSPHSLQGTLTPHGPSWCWCPWLIWLAGPNSLLPQRDLCTSPPRSLPTLWSHPAAPLLSPHTVTVCLSPTQHPSSGKVKSICFRRCLSPHVNVNSNAYWGWDGVGTVYPGEPYYVNNHPAN